MSNTSPTGNAVPPAADLGAGLLHPAAASSRSAASARANGGRLELRIGVPRGVGRGSRPPAQVEAAPAARLVDLGAAHDDAAATLHLAVRAIGRCAAHDADGERLGDVFRDREQLRHGLERAAEVVLVEAGDDDALSHTREPLAHLHQPGAEELAFVDADDLRLVRVAEHVARLLHGARRDTHLAVRDDGVLGVAVVEGGLEDLDALAGDLRTPRPADPTL